MNAPTIVVAAYNRPHALQGLLDSLLAADYDGHTVRLVVSLDKSTDGNTPAVAQAFRWPYGELEVIQHPQRLGLKKHILWCGALTKQYGSIVLLEDDLEVAPTFYRFTAEALGIYGESTMVAGISLYSYQIAESTFLPFRPDTKGQDAYLMQFPSSWGQVWTAQQWQGFEQWLQSNPDTNHSRLPAYIQRWGHQSWKKLFAQYLLETDRYFVYPILSFSTNKGYPGAHFAMRLTLFEVPLYQGKPLYLPPLERLPSYGIYFEPSGQDIQTQNAISVAYAEHRARVNRGEAIASKVGKWWFVAQYNLRNYWRAFWRKLTQ